MEAPRDHKSVVREEFTRQAPAYAAAPVVTNPDALARLVKAVAPEPEARVLEVAAGPGHVAMAFARVCREVVGVDLTPAPVEIARRLAAERGLKNVRFEVGDADHLSFVDGEFDVVVCRIAFHHLETPARVLNEMVRVCKIGGKTAVEDIIASEHPARAAYYNEYERLRDPSHTNALAPSILLRMFAEAGLELESLSFGRAPNPVERWLESSETPPERAEKARAMIEEDLRRDLTGAQPYRRDGVLYFTHRFVTLVGRRLMKAS